MRRVKTESQSLVRVGKWQQHIHELLLCAAEGGGSDYPGFWSYIRTWALVPGTIGSHSRVFSRKWVTQSHFYLKRSFWLSLENGWVSRKDFSGWVAFTFLNVYHFLALQGQKEMDWTHFLRRGGFIQSLWNLKTTKARELSLFPIAQVKKLRLK